MLDEEKPLSFVLNELGLTLRHWDIVVENDQALGDVLDLVRLREEEALVAKIKDSKQHGIIGAIFGLKARHGYSDQTKASPTPAQSFNVTVMIPAPAKNAEEWNRIIDVTPQPLAIEHKADRQ